MFWIPAFAGMTGLIKFPFIRELIEQKQYFVIHAARQSGKTTLLKQLALRINGEGGYYAVYAVYCSLETAQGIIEPEKGIPAIIYSLGTALKKNLLSA